MVDEAVTAEEGAPAAEDAAPVAEVIAEGEAVAEGEVLADEGAGGLGLGPLLLPPFLGGLQPIGRGEILFPAEVQTFNPKACNQ